MLALINKDLRALGVGAYLLLTILVGPESLAEEVQKSVQPMGESAPALSELEARSLLQEADAIRFPSESFQTDITVTNFREGVEDEQRLYRVLSRGNENTIVLTVEPASERGQALLMRGSDLWIYMPSVSQPIRLSLSQRLTGEVANGDLARANFAGDYDAAFLRHDRFEETPVAVLQLTASSRGVTYDSVHYWIALDTRRPLFAEFFARSGRKLKTMRYENFQELAGRKRPTRLVIDDALKKDRRSVLSYNTMVLRELPDHLFTRDYLRRLQ